MGEPELTLGRPEIAAMIDGLHRPEKVDWKNNRLLAVKLVAGGEHTSAQIAELCGISRGRFFRVDDGGLEERLSRKRRGRPEDYRKGVTAEVLEEFRRKLGGNEFATL